MNTQCIVALAGSLAFYSQTSALAKLPEGNWTQKEFIITFWCPPPATDEALAAVAAEGFNLTWTPVEGSGRGRPA